VVIFHTSECGRYGEISAVDASVNAPATPKRMPPLTSPSSMQKEVNKARRSETRVLNGRGAGVGPPRHCPIRLGAAALIPRGGWGPISPIARICSRPKIKARYVFRDRANDDEASTGCQDKLKRPLLQQGPAEIEVYSPSIGHGVAGYAYCATARGQSITRPSRECLRPKTCRP